MTLSFTVPGSTLLQLPNTVTIVHVRYSLCTFSFCCGTKRRSGRRVQTDRSKTIELRKMGAEEGEGMV